MTESFPTVTIIIPSLEGKEENLRRLSDTICRSGIPNDKQEIIAVVNVSPNGRARNVGAIHANGEYLVFIDDDVTFPDAGDLRRIVGFLDDREAVGLCGPAQQLPPGLSDLEHQRAVQMPRNHVESVDTFIETDMVTHACLAISRNVFFEIGMEHPNLISGTDPDLRHRVRSRGLKVGLVPNTTVYHPPVTGWRDHLRSNFLGGRRSRAVRREYPSYHFSADPDRTTLEEPDENTLTDRLIRQGSYLGRRLLQGHAWALAAQFSYQVGYTWETLFPRRWVEPIPYPEPPSDNDSAEWENFIEALRREGEVRFLKGPLPDR